MPDAFEDEPEQTYSIHEYLSNVEDQELEADLVLGGDEGKECTYCKGYMKRQAIFSCLTCTPKGNGGVCTACSLSCHDGHEIVELWTKRNFKCDCGNSKFGDVLCKIFPDKDIENISNSYNHNFRGAYCTCGHPYPDQDAEEQVEMIQCCICEDWFHEEHLGLGPSDGIPRDDDGEPQYEDFICRACSPSCSFLTRYPMSLWNAKMNSEDNILSSQKLNNENCGNDPETMAEGKEGVTDKRSGSVDCNESTMACVLALELEESLLMAEQNGPLFLSKSWREIICKCHKCTDFYRKKGVEFLLDKEDSIVEYEMMGKQKRGEKMQEQEGMEASFINKLGHIQKLELLNGIADMKNEIQSFLESCDSSKIITSDDVGKMFENLARKRRREM